MTEVMLAGDSHGDLDHAILLASTAQSLGIERILHLGDWGFVWRGVSRIPELEEILAAHEVEMDFILGNHEDYSTLAGLGVRPGDEEPVRLTPHLRHLPRGHTFEIGDTIFMAFGGAISMDADDLMEGSTWFREEAITYGQVRRTGFHPIDVLLSHDCPDRVELLDRRLAHTEAMWSEPARRYAAENRHLLGEVVDAHHPRLVVHGHYHHRYTGSRRGGTMVMGLASGDNPGRSYHVLPVDR